MITSRALGLGLGFVSIFKWATVKKLEEVENFFSVRIVTREADLGRGKIAQIPQ